MYGTPQSAAMRAISSAMPHACDSLSITQGPAIRKRFPEPMWTSPTWKEVGKNLIKNHFTAETPRRREMLSTGLSSSVPKCLRVELKPVALSTRHFSRTMEHFHRRSLFLRPAFRAVLIRRRNKCAE